MRTSLGSLGVVAAWVSLAWGGQPPSAPKPFDPVLRHTRAAVADLAKDPDGASRRIDEAWRWVCVNAPTSAPEVFREVALARRLDAQLKAFKGDRPVMAALLAKAPRVASNLCFAVRAGEAPGDALAVLADLNGRWDAATLEAVAPLTAAICVVYDRPVVAHLNENTVKGLTPRDAFEYFARMRPKLVFSPATTPTELLVYQVAPAAPLHDLIWAMNRYAGQANVGPRYNEVPYDTEHFKRGKEKKLSMEGVTLPNCLRFGGVCTDQAYFAETVGKAVGVPACTVTASSAEVGHAWLGFLKQQGRRAKWDFDAGRYDEYEDLRGDVVDPQTGETIADGALASVAETFALSEEVRQAAQAFVDAAMMMTGVGLLAPEVEGQKPVVNAVPRTGSTDDRLALLKAAVALHPTLPSAWSAAGSVARSGGMSVEQKKQWADAVHTVTGNAYPDFSFAVMTPLIQSVEDVAVQRRLWESQFAAYRGHRPDLAARALMEEASMWRGTGGIKDTKVIDPGASYDCYLRVVNLFINDGPFAVEALTACETLLREKGAMHAALPMYEDAFRRAHKPKNASTSPFTKASNWFRIGVRYAALLRDNGRHSESANLLRQLNATQP